MITKLTGKINIVAHKNILFGISAAVLVPGIIFLAVFGLPLGIDFTGGTLWELKFSQKPASQTLLNFFANYDIEIVSLQQTETSFILRTRFLAQDQHDKILLELTGNFGQIEDVRFESIGPTVSANLARKAILALGFATIAILAFIAWAFRKVPKPASAISFGVCAILALVHDVGVLVGSFAILAKAGAVVDSLFVVAALTVIGFSVHDTIVVFDRVRENLAKFSQKITFSDIVNFSILQTLGRSLATSITVILVLLALLLFGGSTIKWFVVALLIGIVSGTYSSIFTAAPLLVVWNEKFSKS